MKLLAVALATTALALSAPAGSTTASTIETPEAKAAASELADEAYDDFVDRFDATEIAPNKYRWNAEGASGPSRVVISLDRQMAFVYRGDTLVGAASVSTARDGMITPKGIFPIWLKKKMHYSRKYDNAPMPYMQMIDQYGIALHAGHNPGYPASHGCIRLPKSFAAKLFAMTDIGTTVHIGA
ncbi:L,D-transpeptidase family protein [Sphingomicrobium nitratireducens]|uniref:L,D-transpeptidase family protein n=1 Tax=Sphingomicrobium nitratireducens TaxID=2964666 RepID=UPI0022408F63|nr:L,D-transpeptidase family protein [Sphingomicrobium nitratireducens]